MKIQPRVLPVVVALTMSAGLLGCAGDPTGQYGPGPKENTGTLLGALGGAAIGSAFGGGTSGHVAGALIGAGVGGLIGNRIGASLDERDRQMAYAAELNALNSGAAGAPVAWRNDATGRYGSIVPGPAYIKEGRNCRAFTHTIYVDGAPQTARGVACRNPDGSWTPVA